MKSTLLLTILCSIALSNIASAGFIVDVTFSGNTNDIYSVEIQDGKGQKNFDAFLEIPQSEKIGLCENIVVTDFEVDEQTASISIKATSNTLNGFETLIVEGNKRKFPVIQTINISATSLIVFLDTWSAVGGVQEQNEHTQSVKLRVRKVDRNN